MKTTFAAAILTATLLAAGAASAASQSPTTDNSANAQASKSASTDYSMQSLNHSNLRQQLHQQLTSAGYTSINIMPSSFYVRAKNKDGQPVAMVIGPDSFVAVTDLNAGENGKQAQGSTTQPSAGAQTPAKQQ